MFRAQSQSMAGSTGCSTGWSTGRARDKARDGARDRVRVRARIRLHNQHFSQGAQSIVREAMDAQSLVRGHAVA
eukprot:854378-Prymnesium_polylepis.1